MTMWAEAGRTGSPFQTEFRIHRSEGDVRYVRLNARRVSSEHADGDEYVGSIEDITGRLSAEAENAKALALQRAILEHAAYAIISTTSEGIITNFNPAAEKLLGYEASDLVDRYSPAVFHLESEVVARANDFSAVLGIHLEPGFEVFVCKSRYDLPNEHHWTYVRKDGSHVPVMLGITALRNDAKQIIGYLGIAKDIMHQLCSTACIGVVLGPSIYSRGEDILRDADTAMYEAKRAGRARHLVFTDEMHTQLSRRLLVENELRIAVGTDQLSLHYQPIVSLVDGQITAVEALLRWNNPILGMIGPAEFIPIAQESDLILHESNSRTQNCRTTSRGCFKKQGFDPSAYSWS